METSKENIFQMKYTSVFKDQKIEKKNWTSRIKEFILKNKIISVSLIIFFMCFILNCVLVYNFIRILENM